MGYKLPNEAAKFDTQAWAHYQTSKEAFEKENYQQGIDDAELFYYYWIQLYFKSWECLWGAFVFVIEDIQR